MDDTQCCFKKQDSFRNDHGHIRKKIDGGEGAEIPGGTQGSQGPGRGIGSSEVDIPFKHVP